jgi:hypothetical protein
MVQPMLAAEYARGADNASPTQVWGALATEQQERVIHLLAHLACRVALAPCTRPPQEALHGPRPRPH